MNTNLVQHFQSICGIYSLNKMEQGLGQWTANVWAGGRKIGTFIYVEPQVTEGINVAWNVNHATLMISKFEDQVAIAEWADKAGPYGFESPENFVMHLFKWARLLQDMRTAVRKGHLVAYPRTAVDMHDMPLYFNKSKGKVTNLWISGYIKSHKNMKAVNHEVA